MIGICMVTAGCNEKESLYTIESDTGFMYARKQLEEERQDDYDAIYEGLMNMDDEIKVDYMEEDELVELYSAVMYDHPEIFWTETFAYTQMDFMIFGSWSELYPHYLYTAEEAKTYTRQLKEKAEEILTDLPAGASDYEKVKFVYDHIIDHTAYDTEAADNQNILSVMLNETSVCAGYAKTMQYLLERLKIPCSYQVGVTLKDQNAHAWNMVLMDGEYYYMDVTHGDAAVDGVQDGHKTYAFFGFTSDEMLDLYDVHTAYEVTDALKDNYYVKENAYITGIDDAQLLEIMQYEENLRQRKLSVKCGDEEMLQKLKAYMLDDDHIFVLLRQLGIEVHSVRYVEYPALGVITFTY